MRDSKKRGVDSSSLARQLYRLDSRNKIAVKNNVSNYNTGLNQSYVLGLKILLVLVLLSAGLLLLNNLDWSQLESSSITGAVIGVSVFDVELQVENDTSVNFETNEVNIENGENSINPTEDLTIHSVSGNGNSTRCGYINSSINLTANVVSEGSNDCFYVYPNITLDCQGFNITALSSGSYWGVYLDYNATLKNCYINNFAIGINMIGSTATALNNTINCPGTTSTSGTGIRSISVTNHYILNNTIYDCTNGIGIYSYSYEDNISFNKIFNNQYGIYFSSLTKNHFIFNNTLYNNSKAIYFDATHVTGSINNSVMYNYFYNNSYGVDYSSTTNTTAINSNNFSNNNFSNNQYNLDWVVGSVLYAENNYWGFNDCSNISLSIESGAVDYDPYINSSGSVLNCSDHCGMIIFSSKNLTTNLNNCPNNGIRIFENSENVTLNCLGNSIIGINGSNTYGITTSTSQSYFSNTISNCKIEGFSVGIGSTTDSGDSNTVVNNTLSNCYVGVDGYDKANIFNNTIRGNGSTYNGTIGIYVIGNPTLSVQNNTFLYLSKGVTFAGNYEPHGNFKNNYFLSNIAGYDLYYFSADLSNINFTSESFVNCTRGILINVTDPASTSDNLHDLIFLNSTFSNNTLDLDYQAGEDGNLTLINCIFNKTKINVASGGTVYVRKYIDVNITTPNNIALFNATATAFNSLGLLEDQANTSGEGKTRLEVLAYYFSNGVTYYLTPTRVLAQKSNFTENESIISLVSEATALVNLSLREFNCGDTIYSNLNLGNDLICSGGINLGANNILIKGNGYSVKGIGTGIGVNGSGRNGTIIDRLTITNFTTGIYFYNSNYSIVSNSNLSGNINGIIINNSDNNVIANTSFRNIAYSLISSNDDFSEDSLINVTIDLNNLSLEGKAAIYYKWYISIQSNYSDSSGNPGPLPNANVSGYFNSTGLIDDSIITNSKGSGKLTLTELKKNSSGTYYLTPHNITLSYYYLGTYITNETSVNLTTTNNTHVALNITLNCTAPQSEMTISSNTLFCPGTFYTTGTISITGGKRLTCLNTILQRDPTEDTYPNGINVNADNVEIYNCNFKDYGVAIRINGRNNVTIRNGNLTTVASNNLGVYASSSTNIKVDNCSFDSLHPGILLADTNNSIISNNTFLGIDQGIRTDGAYHNSFQDNVLKGLTTGIILSYQENYVSQPSSNNSFYHNNFSGNTYNYYYYNATQYGGTNTFNTSIAGYAQGNEYSDYCDKGTDSNGDGYADSGSVSVYPYSENISSKVYDLTNGNAGVIDYGPKIISCPAAEVYLGSGGSGGSSSSTTATAAAVVSTPAVSAKSQDYYKPEDVKEFLKAESRTESKETITSVTLTLENTGTKRMQLFPELFQEIEDPFFIVTRKTLGYENSLFSKISNLWYSEDLIAGRLLKAQLLNPEQIILEPGQKIEKTLEIEEGFTIPRQMKIKFTTFGETVMEKEVAVTKKAVSGTAIDLDTANNLMDFYVVIVPASEELEQYYGSESPTGAAITDLNNLQSDEYLVEFNIQNQNGEQFSELYGPYKVDEEQGLVFAQQLKYNPEKYSGDSIISTRIYHGGKVLVKDETEVNLGNQQYLTSLPWLWMIIPGLMLIIILVTGVSAVRTKKQLVAPAEITPRKNITQEIQERLNKLENLPPPKLITELKPEPNPIRRVITALKQPFIRKAPRKVITSLEKKPLFSLSYPSETPTKKHLPILRTIIVLLFITAVIYAIVLFQQQLIFAWQKILDLITALGYWILPLILIIILIILIIIYAKVKPKSKTTVSALSPAKYIELMNFIKECRNQRISDHKIKKLLLKNGWEEKVVVEFLRK